MPRLAKPQEKESRRHFRDMDVITNKELARAVAKRSGVRLDYTLKVLNSLGDIIIEFVIQGFCVTIYNLGSFFLRELRMPSYSIKEKRGVGYKKKWSFSFKKPYAISKKINETMIELYPDETKKEVE